jgi:hypothetical protein
MALHPAYQQIIGMRKEAISLILDELQREEDRWLGALKSARSTKPSPTGLALSFLTAISSP